MTKYKRKSEREFKPKRKVELRNAREAEAILIFMEAGLMPQDPFKGVNYKWRSKCMRCGEIVSPRFADVKGGNGGCKPCGMKFMQTPEFLEEIMTIMKQANLEPLEPYKGADVKWKCKCLKCGNTVSPRANNVKRGHGGCIFCMEGAFKLNRPAYLYFVHNQQLGSLKVGIGNYETVNDRLDSHNKSGWNTLAKYHFEKGETAFKVEQIILKWIRKDLQIPIHLSNLQFTHGGASETFADDSVSLIEVKRKIEEIIGGL